ncbi:MULTISPECIES: AAA family ATPase [Serratia]|uniref:AAA family ATPase n=1 Tax=Serratia TaxID=613 RepID=UPI0006600783|nr:AAA family ATPase [Serratia sp. 506_PEND]
MTDINDVINTLSGLIKSKTVTQTQIANEIGKSGSAISAFLKGEYAGDNQKLASALRVWLENYQQQQQLPERPQFVRTPTVDEMWAIFTFVRLSGCINIIVGAPGVGKTEAARRYKAENPNTWMMTLCPAHSSVTECLLEMAEALDIPDAPASKGALARLMRRRLTGTRGLLIVDEADHLGVEGLEQLRAIQDATGVGMVLIGNPNGLSKATRTASGADDLARLHSRIARSKRIPKPKNADINAIATAWGIAGTGEMTLIHAIAAKPGALRVLSHTLNQAWLMANGNGQSALTEQHIKAAFKEVYGNAETLSLKG